LLEVGHSSEEEDESLSSQTDSSSDWGTDFSGRSSPAEATRSMISPPPIVMSSEHDIRPDVDFNDEAMEWDSYYDLMRDGERPSSPDELNLLSEAQVEETLLPTNVPNVSEPQSSNVTLIPPSPSLSTTIPIPIPIPSMPSSRRTHQRNASGGTPGASGPLSMTPPASVTPRFLTWGVRSTSPPFANGASTSPTPNRRRRTSATPAWLSQTSTWNAF